MYKKFIFTILMVCLIDFGTGAQQTEKMYLSGTDKDHTVDWEFKVSGGRKAGIWHSIPVPSCWEMQGFGTYRYWDDWSEDPVPDSIGLYRYLFEVPGNWEHKDVDIVFGGVMTDADVKINGIPAGPVHQGGFYEFRYNITGKIRVGEENLLEIKVNRYSNNHSVNLAERRADFWLFSGVYRPVWLEAFPENHIESIAVDAKHNGEITIAVNLKHTLDISELKAQVYTNQGQKVGSSFSSKIQKGQQKYVLENKIESIKPWTAEWPNMYKLKVELISDQKTVHECSKKFGFRTVEVREADGIYVNNVKVLLKGVNRHSFWPTSGRTTNKTISIEDIELMKEMNMNAVRMSHYPPDKHFLKMTDSLGLYVIDELTGWQDSYDTKVGEKLVKELVRRDLNHPSIILWANGNEGGWNFELDDDFDIWDLQKRVVIHPWETKSGINTIHYQGYDCCTGFYLHGDDIVMPTEFLHGLYDGGAAAGLEDTWNLMIRNPLTAGGFLWAFADEGIVRLDWDGAIDVTGNRAPDGIVGPYREKEGSFYAIKEIWSPVYLPMSELDQLPKDFINSMRIENRYDHTNLRSVDLKWRLIKFPPVQSDNIGFSIESEGDIVSPNIEPHHSGSIDLNLPENWPQSDALFISAKNHLGKEIYTWTWMIKEPRDFMSIGQNVRKESTQVSESESTIIIEKGDMRISFDKTTGQILEIFINDKKLSLTNGPRILQGVSELKELKQYKEGDAYVVKCLFDGQLKEFEWRVLSEGWLSLRYAYRHEGNERLDYLGVSFDYPESKVNGLRWLGKGPYRVWKNRLKGNEFNVWDKKYNNTITGLSWEYPEFKGFHDDVFWAVLDTDETPITMIFDQRVYLRLFTPDEARGENFDPRYTHVEFPPGDISFMDGIIPIGTKFHPADHHGPMGQKNITPGRGRKFERTVYFYLGKE